jgi:hypothetical protein
MWPFKNKLPATNSPGKFNSILCVPGPWSSDKEAKLAVVEATEGEYIVAGGVMMNTKKKIHFTFEVCERDERMKESFAVAGMVTGVTESFLEDIDKHNSVVYISSQGGGLQQAEDIGFAAEALLKAGGIGVKVETAGKAFEKEVWLDFTENFQESDAYDMFVIDSLVDEETTFSCGMRNLGLKDTIVSDIDFQEAVKLIRIFGFYQIVDKPTILPNQTFTPALDSPRYKITEERNPPYKNEEQLGNPFGVWRLTRL